MTRRDPPPLRTNFNQVSPDAGSGVEYLPPPQPRYAPPPEPVQVQYPPGFATPPVQQPSPLQMKYLPQRQSDLEWVGSAIRYDVWLHIFGWVFAFSWVCIGVAGILLDSGADPDQNYVGWIVGISAIPALWIAYKISMKLTNRG